MTHTLIYFGGIFAGVMSLNQLLVRNRNTGNLILAGMFAVVAAWLINLALVFSGDIQAYPHLLGLYLPLTYLFGPLLYLYYKNLISDQSSPFKPIHLLHFLPAVIIPLLASPIYMLDASEKLTLIKQLGTNQMPPEQYGMVLFVGIAQRLSIVFYSLMLLRNTLKVYRSDSVNRKLALILSCFLGYILAVQFFNVLTRIFMEPRLSNDITALLIVAMLVGWFLVGQRIPRFLHLLNTDSGLAPREESLQNLDIRDLMGRLEFLMLEEKAFADEDLSLDSLAALLEISPLQLSQLINRKYNKNFKSFLSEHRIVESRRLLLDEPDRNIISIAYAVGFQSKSAFNAAFSKHTGESPSQYRFRRETRRQFSRVG